MTKINSTAPARSRKPHKPAKPSKDFPLFPSGNGLWAKKIRGKLHYFGSWRDDPKGVNALEWWLAEKDELLAGRIPRRRNPSETPDLDELCNRFLTTKRNLLDSGELSPHTWDGYEAVCKELFAAFGKDRLVTDIMPEDFEALRAKWASKWGPVRLGSEINRARVVFNYAYKNRLIPTPMLYGEGFKRPSAKTLRLNRAAKGIRMFEADELRRMVKTASQQMKAMILLGINCGFGNNDVAQLPMTAMDLAGGWINYPRPKTGIDRRCPLWPATVKAIREWLKIRPAAKDEANADLVFLTVRGNSWSKDSADRPITHECRKLLDELEINGGRNFYTLRHTFETVGGESRDQIATSAIMGHVDASMSAVYRERISDDRLQAVAEYVRAWVFAKPAKRANARKK